MPATSKRERRRQQQALAASRAKREKEEKLKRRREIRGLIPELTYNWKWYETLMCIFILISALFKFVEKGYFFFEDELP